MDMLIIWSSFLDNNFLPEGLAQGESMVLLEYQAIPSLRDVAHDSVFVYLVIDQPRGLQKRCRLSWQTNSALVYEPICGGRGESRGLIQ